MNLETEKAKLLTSLETLLKKVNDIKGNVFTYEVGIRLDDLNLERKTLCTQIIEMGLISKEYIYFTMEDTNQNISYASSKPSRKRDL